jgi:glycosyltransferase involved in cell wall biosynthesis
MTATQNDQDGIYAVIPAFNEKDTIAQVVSSVINFTPHVVVVDDGSTDQTASLAAAQGAQTIIHERNMGYDKSIDDGFKFVSQQKNVFAMFTFDADGQHNAEVLHTLVKPLLDGQADVVVGVRPYKARIAEKALALYTKYKYGIEDPLCGLKAYKNKVYQDIGFFDRINSIGTELVIRAKKKGYRIVQVPITIKPRVDHSRFGQAIKGNYRIFMAFLRIFIFLII